jgi:Protein of unknown function (DUF2442)
MSKHRIVRVIEVEAREGRKLALTFDDGTSGVADVTDLLIGPVFEAIREDDRAFAQVGLDGYGSISWRSGADLDAWVLHELTAAETAAT